MELDIRFGDSIAESEGEVLVVPMYDGGSWGPGGDWLAEQMPGLEEYLETAGFKAAAASTTTVPASGDLPFAAVNIVGLGEEADAEGLRAAAGAAAKHVAPSRRR